MNGELELGVQRYLGIEDDNQRFTIRRAVLWCLGIIGARAYDVDAAACEESHKAPLWYGWKGGHLFDGLTLPWLGHTFVNPPWDDIEPWIARASGLLAVRHQRQLETVSLLLPGGRTHRPWWQKWVEPYLRGKLHDGVRVSVYNPPERFPYGCPGNPEGIGMPEPNFTSVLIVLHRTY